MKTINGNIFLEIHPDGHKNICLGVENPSHIEETKPLTRNQILEYFRSDEYIEELDENDKEEIALACLHNSDYLATILDRAIDNWNSVDNLDGSNVPDCLIKES